MATNVTTQRHKKINWVMVTNAAGLLAILIIAYFLYGVIRDTDHLAEENLVISIQHLNPASAQELLESRNDVILLDIRTPIEWQLGNHIGGAISIPVYEFEKRALTELPDRNVPIIVMSFSDDPRSMKAAEWLIDHGYTRVYNLDGGIFAWASDGFPTKSFRDQIGFVPE